jgi:hypothetical protein
LHFSTISRFADDLNKRNNKLKQLREEKENTELTLISEQFKPTDRSDRLVFKKFKKDFYQTLEMIKPLPQIIKEEERITEEEEKREVIPVAVVARTSLGEDEAGGQEDTRSRSISNGKEYTSKKS